MFADDTLVKLQVRANTDGSDVESGDAVEIATSKMFEGDFVPVPQVDGDVSVAYA